MSVYVQNNTSKAIPFPYGLTIAGGSVQEIPQDTWRKIFHEWMELGEMIRRDWIKVIVRGKQNGSGKLDTNEPAKQGRS